MVGWVHVWAEAVLVRCMQGRQAFSGQPACEGIMEMDLVELDMWRKVWHRAIYLAKHSFRADVRPTAAPTDLQQAQKSGNNGSVGSILSKATLPRLLESVNHWQPTNKKKYQRLKARIRHWQTATRHLKSATHSPGQHQGRSTAKKRCSLRCRM